MQRAALALALLTACAPPEGAPGPVNEAPTEGRLSVSPASPRTQADTIVCRPEGATDPEGGAVTWDLSWLRNGLPWTGASTGALPGDTVPAAAVRAGDVWTCVATPVDASDARGPTVLATVRVRRPNVLLVLFDDIGLGDVGTYGGRVPTPSLDTLAAEGVRFDAGYAAAPVCSPSRAGLLTGRQPNRFGFEFNLGPADVAEREVRGLPHAEVPVAELLRDVGYDTALVGKWHLGLAGHQWPFARGFDDFAGFLSGQRWHQRPGLPGAVDVWPEAEIEPPVWPFGHWSEVLQANATLAPLADDDHLTDRFADDAVAWLQARREAPFFLVLSMFAAHEPVQASAEHLALIPNPPDSPEEHAYLAMIAATDRALGRVLDAVRVAGVEDDTLVVVQSDNGCPALFGLCSNGGLAGGKVQLTEGGLRVPMLARWPDRIPAGTVFDRPVSGLDWTPTVVAAVGASLPQDRAYDGVDLLPHVRGEAEVEPHPVLTWRLGGAHAVREGDWKALQVNERRWLFHLASDPGETQDRALDEPELLDRLVALGAARDALYAPPAWGPQQVAVDYHGEVFTIGY